MQGKSNFLRPGRARTNAQHLLGKTVNVGSECGGLKRRSGAASEEADRVDDRGSLEDFLSEISRGTYVCNMFIISRLNLFISVHDYMPAITPTNGTAHQLAHMREELKKKQWTEQPKHDRT
jgi:hypothetical protein